MPSGSRSRAAREGQTQGARPRPSASVILAPGFGGTATQPLLLELDAAFRSAGVAPRRVEFALKGRPSPGYSAELAVLRKARTAAARGGRPVALVGRSFGGRMCTFLSAVEPPAALVILGYPLAPKGVLREADAEALRSLRCPTLIIQGDHDELGPLPAVRRVVRQNPALRLTVITGAKHAFGSKAREALAVRAAVAFVREALGLPPDARSELVDATRGSRRRKR